MIQATKPTLSFGVLLIIAMGLVGAVYYLSQQLEQRNMIQLPMVTPEPKELAQNQSVKPEEDRIVSSEDWQEYSDNYLEMSFKYPKDWQVRNYSRESFDVIVITPSVGKDKIRIYVSDREYIGMAGLKTSTAKIGDLTGVAVDDMVYGVKQGSTYFTFDSGQDLQLIPEFTEIVKTVAFGN